MSGQSGGLGFLSFLFPPSLFNPSLSSQSSAASSGGNWFVSLFYGLTGSLALYILTWSNFDIAADRIRANNDIENVFDFIVVGSGRAGSIVANRLSQTYRVLLLEAGGDPHPFQEIPSFAIFLLNYPELDYSYKSVSQKQACKALLNKQAQCSAGKGLGGSSNSDFLVYSRGLQKDFDNWAKITGDTSWKYEKLLQYFKKYEDFVDDREKIHGHNGELKIETPPYTGIGEFFIKAASELGYNRTDLNGGKLAEGFDIAKYTIKRARRFSAFSSFIRPIRDKRKNLVIYKYSTVNKILMREGQNEAFGVEYLRHGQTKFAFVSKEIIVSAGALNSPKLLMLSGIGPKDHLQQIGIQPIVNLPVGQGLKDHVATFLGSFFVDVPITAIIDRDMTFTEFMNYQITGTGKLTTTGFQAMGYINSNYTKSENWPDIELIALGAGGYKNGAKDFSHAFNGNLSYMEPYFTHSLDKDSFDVIVSIGRPKQNGEILLEDANPKTPPLINPKYFENDHDIDVMVQGMKKAIQLIENTDTFSSIGGKFTEHYFPGCEEHEFRSDKYLECYAKHKTISLNHFVGTCKMGKKDSPDSVLDSQMRVIGVKGLRVIDSSIMPDIPIGFPGAATYMIGEKGADLIRKFWANSNESTISKTKNEQRISPISVLNLNK